MTLYNIPAHSYGGWMQGKPLIGVVHSAESPLKAGYARSLARYWFASPTCQTSAHEIIDPRDVVVMVPDSRIAWHCGNGNKRSKGYEQAGYARFTRAEWTTDDGIAQLEKLAARIAADAKQYDWPLRWSSDEQIRDAHYRGLNVAGLATHDDMRRAVGGTTHHDPMPNYPRDLLLAAVVRHVEGDDDIVQKSDIDAIAQEVHDRVWKDRWTDPLTGKQQEAWQFLRQAAPLSYLAQRFSDLWQQALANDADAIAERIAVKAAGGQVTKEIVKDAIRELVNDKEN